MLHLTDVDANRHLYGVESKEAKEALKRHDKRLGEIVRALEETGEMESTTVVLLGIIIRRMWTRLPSSIMHCGKPAC